MKHNPNINEEEDWKVLAPNLFKMKKENPFEVPADYFESLSSNLINRCLEDQKKAPFFLRIFGFQERVSFRHLIQSPRMVLAIASCLVIVFWGIRSFEIHKRNAQTPSSIGFNEMCSSPLLESIDEETLTDALAEKGYFSKSELNSEDKISCKDMEDYLIKNNIDVN